MSPGKKALIKINSDCPEANYIIASNVLSLETLNPDMRIFQMLVMCSYCHSSTTLQLSAISKMKMRKRYYLSAQFACALGFSIVTARVNGPVSLLFQSSIYHNRLIECVSIAAAITKGGLVPCKRQYRGVTP